MRPRTLLILLVLVAGLGSFIYFYERKLPSSDERAEQAKKVFPGLETKDVAGISLAWAGNDVRLEKVAPPKAAVEKPAKGVKPESAASPGTPMDEEAGTPSSLEPAERWNLIRPLRAAADPSVVDGLLQALAGLEKSRTIDAPDAKALGLDKPQATVRLKVAGVEKVLKVGAKIPTGASVVVAVEGEPAAYIVSDSFLTSLERQPGEWRDRQLFHGDRDAIDRISLAGPGGSRVLLARRGGSFWIESPIADRADRELVDGLLGDLTGLRAQSFVDAATLPAATLGLAPPNGPHGIVEVVEKGVATPLRFELGATAPGSAAAPPPAGEGGEPPPPPAPALYVRADGQLAEVQTGLAKNLDRAPDDWRSKSLSGLEVYQIQSLRVDAPGAPPLLVERAGTDWKRGKDTVGYTPVSDLLFALTSAKGDHLLSPEEAKSEIAALDHPVLSFTAKGEGGVDETLILYPPTPQGPVPARASGRDVILLLPKATLDDLQKQVAIVRSAKPEAPAKPAAQP